MLQRLIWRCLIETEPDSWEEMTDGGLQRLIWRCLIETVDSI